MLQVEAIWWRDFDRYFHCFPPLLGCDMLLLLLLLGRHKDATIESAESLRVCFLSGSPFLELFCGKKTAVSDLTRRKQADAHDIHLLLWIFLGKIPP